MTRSRIRHLALSILSAFMLGLAVAAVAPTAAQAESMVPVYRLQNPYTHFHLLTTDRGEYDSLGSSGWVKEGIAWQSPETGTPVYRLYNPSDDNHLYTTDLNEFNTLPSFGWRQESVAFYGLQDGSYPVYRLYFPSNNDHLYTMDGNEYGVLGTRGWNQEGVKFYVSGPGTPAAPDENPGGGATGGGVADDTGGNSGGTTDGGNSGGAIGGVVGNRHKDDFPYWVNTNSDGKFHRNGCRWVKDEYLNDPQTGQSWYGANSREEAASYGRDACKVCKP